MPKSLTFLWVLCFCCFLTFCNGAQEDQPNSGLSELETMIKASPLVKLTKKTYSKFVLKGPRDYFCIVFALPEKDPRFEALDQIVHSLREVAKSYEISLKAKGPEATRELIFFIVDPSRDANLLKNHGVMSPVALYVLPPLKGKGSTAQPLDNSKVFDFRAGNWEAEDVLRWITKSTKVSFSIYETPMAKLLRYRWYAATAVGAIVALLALVLAIKNFVGPFHGMFWYWVCIGVWMSCFGGVHFCILRASPYYMVHPRTKELMLFHPNSQAQFYAEGFIATGLELTGGLLLVCLTLYYPKMNNGIKKRLTGYVLTSMFFGAVYGMRKLYFMKQGW